MLKGLTSRFIQEEKGAPIVEIVILIAISALIAAFLFPVLRNNLASWFNDMVGNISKGIGGKSTDTPANVAPGDVKKDGWAP